MFCIPHTENFMDKTGIIVVSICALLFGWWFVAQQKITQQQAAYARTNQVAVAQSRLAATNSGFVTATATAATVTVPVAFDTNAPEQTIVLANAKARYTFTSRGGGLKLVELLDYPQTVSARWKKKDGADTNGVASLNTLALVPALAVLGDASLVGDGNFSLTKTADGVRAEKVFTSGLRLTKEFQLGSNYLVNASVRLENTSDKPLNLPAQEVVVGTATPMDADDNGQFEGAMWSDGKKAADQPLAAFSGGGCSRGVPKTEVVVGANNVVWAAAHNQFFTLMAMLPKEPAQQMIARPVTLPRFPNVAETNMALPRGIQTTLLYPAGTLTANSSIERQIVLFAGPKEYRTLADIGAEFHNRADDVMGFGSLYGFCAKPLLLAMNWLHDVTRLGYGLVIILLTVLLRAIFWPLTAKSTRSMKRMQALAPEINALKEKYKDDPQKQTAKTWELYKKNKVSPMSGCLPMLVQMPVFFGFFSMIRGAIELRGAHFLWAADLSKPDTLFMIPGITFIPFNISTPEGLPFNLLPLLMSGTMVWQAHLQPPSPGMDPGQAKMMRYMPLLFLAFLYNYSSGMALYMVVSTLASVLQTKLTKALNNPAEPPAGPATNPALTPASKSKK
jgi:YidC/Oxa1 family membrane protein insertase